MSESSPFLEFAKSYHSKPHTVYKGTEILERAGLDERERAAVITHSKGTDLHKLLTSGKFGTTIDFIERELRPTVTQDPILASAIRKIRNLATTRVIDQEPNEAYLQTVSNLQGEFRDELQFTIAEVLARASDNNQIRNAHMLSEILRAEYANVQFNTPVQIAKNINPIRALVEKAGITVLTYGYRTKKGIFPAWRFAPVGTPEPAPTTTGYAKPQGANSAEKPKRRIERRSPLSRNQRIQLLKRLWPRYAKTGVK